MKFEKEGITYLYDGEYYDGIRQWCCHKLKENDHDVIDYVARQLAPLVPKDSILVPTPGHNGYADHTLLLSKAICRYAASATVADVLKGDSRHSFYEIKKRGGMLSPDDMGFKQTSPLPKNKNIILVDGVVDTGQTSKAALKALGGGTVLAFAMTDTILKPMEDRRIVFHR